MDLLDDEADCPQESNEWVEAVDRGGLTRVNNITFELFWMMGEDTERHYVYQPCFKNPRKMYRQGQEQ